MRRIFLFGLVVLFLGLISCGSRPSVSASSSEVPFIDVEAAMADLQPALKLSDFGKEVRYVPLETNDSCLLSGNVGVGLTDSCLVVSTNYGLIPLVYSFERESGRFISQVGHFGEDSTGYTSPAWFYNEQDGLLYFVRNPNQLQKYDRYGRYQGRMPVWVQSELPFSFIFIDSLALGYHKAPMDKTVSHSKVLSVFDKNGVEVDSVLRTSFEAISKEVESKSTAIFSLFGTDVHVSVNKDNTVDIDLSSSRGSALWNCGGEIRLKDGLNDTIYAWNPDKGLRPSVVFRLGRWRLDEESWQRNDSRDKLLVLGVRETENKLYFRCLNRPFETLREATVRLFSGGGNPFDLLFSEVYHGVYDKQTGLTRMAPWGKGILDDLNGFLPFEVGSNTQSEFVGILKADKIVAWLEKHPEAKGTPRLAPLLEVKGEDNPVVVIVSDKVRI